MCIIPEIYDFKKQVAKIPMPAKPEKVCFFEMYYTGEQFTYNFHTKYAVASSLRAFHDPNSRLLEQKTEGGITKLFLYSGSDGCRYIITFPKEVGDLPDVINAIGKIEREP